MNSLVLLGNRRKGFVEGMNSLGKLDEKGNLSKKKFVEERVFEGPEMNSLVLLGNLPKVRFVEKRVFEVPEMNSLVLLGILSNVRIVEKRKFEGPELNSLVLLGNLLFFPEASWKCLDMNSPTERAQNLCSS